MAANDKTACDLNGPSKMFNFCNIAKALIAIPAIPMIGAIMAGLFKDPVLQFIVAAYTGAIVILLAQKIDRLPVFSPMVFNRKPD